MPFGEVLSCVENLSGCLCVWCYGWFGKWCCEWDEYDVRSLWCETKEMGAGFQWNGEGGVGVGN